MYLQVDLIEYNAKQAQFKIMPRYKVKAEGDIVRKFYFFLFLKVTYTRKTSRFTSLTFIKEKNLFFTYISNTLTSISHILNEFNRTYSVKL